jgi:hypothetical protein
LLGKQHSAKPRTGRCSTLVRLSELPEYQRILRATVHGLCCTSARSGLECTANLVRPWRPLVEHLVTRKYTGTLLTKESRLKSIILRHLKDASYRTRVEKYEDQSNPVECRSISSREDPFTHRATALLLTSAPLHRQHEPTDCSSGHGRRRHSQEERVIQFGP